MFDSPENSTMKLHGWLLAGWCVATSLLHCPQVCAEDSGSVFPEQMRQLFHDRCGKCHSDSTRRGELNLSSWEGVQRGGESGEALLAADWEEGMLWLMIEGDDMPPEGEPPLTESEKQQIKTWLVASAANMESTERELSQHDVLPIVLLRCAACHGRQLQRGDLDMRTITGMRDGGTRGPAFIAGDADRSLMIQRIESHACPPQDQLLKYFVRRPTETEVEMLRAWIDAGGPLDDRPPDVATTEPDTLVSDEDRKHWAFQTPQRPDFGQGIDDFIGRRLKSTGLSFSPRADRGTLIRRAYLDLHGLPPTREQWRHWRDLAADDWFEQLVDSLLESPRYGERWGRYWLDVAGYADSEGGISADPLRPVAWKYRDYVIRAFNDDKPYDRFLLEQLAGDELVDFRSLKPDEVTPELVDNLIATGFLRMGIDQTGSRTMNFVPERLGVIDDAITVIGSGLMGLTLQCAKCHSHKYDPLPQRDYYRLKAVLQGAMDEHDWLSFKNRRLELGVAAELEAAKQINPPLQKQLRTLENQKKSAERELQDSLLAHHHSDLSSKDRNETIAALRIADNNRTLPQRNLVEKLRSAEVLPDDQQPPHIVAQRERIRQLDLQLVRTRRQLAPTSSIRALWDRGQPSPTYILLRGEHNKPGRWVGPGVPSVLTDGKTPFQATPPGVDEVGNSSTGRRLAFARWLTRPDHPLTSRVMVNRVWHHHFGTGIVKSLENFGAQGEPPSHPALLDWLAIEFVQRGWSVKALHRLIMNSRTYQQTSHVEESLVERDPDNRLLSRMPLSRMDAESLRDSLLHVSGLLDLTTLGGSPEEVVVSQKGLVSVIPTAGGRQRRSVYLQYRRTAIPSFMSAFDYPKMGPNCISRSHSTIAPQALMLLNDRQVYECSTTLADHIQSLIGDHQALATAEDRSAAVTALYEVALSRAPNNRELALGQRALDQFVRQWQGKSNEALATYCHTVLNSAAFVYID